MNDEYEVHEQQSEGSRHDLHMLNEHHVRALCNILTEAPFFYREDDPDLFAYLRTHAEDFRAFFLHYFRWDLSVDRRMARVIKGSEYNKALRPSERDMFDLTRRDECTVFLLLVEFYEKTLRDLGISYDDEGDVRFLLADFVQYCLTRFGEELGEAHPDDRTILDACRRVFPRLVKFRFITRVEKAEAERDETLPGGMREHVLYEFLPGIHCYRPDVLTFKEIMKLYGEKSGDEGDEAEGEDDVVTATMPERNAAQTEE